MLLDAGICFRMISWCFDPVATTHPFVYPPLRVEKIARFGREVMTSLWVETRFGVCLWQFLYN